MKIEMLWEQLLGKGLEHLILYQNASIEAHSLIVGVLNDNPYRIQYQIVCDLNWNVQRMRVADLLNDRVVELIKNGEDWLDKENNPIEILHGCIDVDIMVTPFTNTLPIQRLKLKPNEAQEISVVYVSVLDLHLSKFDQRYTCISQGQDGGIYKYESLNSGFTSELKIDEDAMVIDYPGIFKLAWKRKEDS